MEIDSAQTIEDLRKDAWKYHNVQRDVKTKPCEYSLLIFRLDTMEDTIRSMKYRNNRSYGLPVIFQLTEHTMCGIQLIKNNKPIYPFNIQQQMCKGFTEIQEDVYYERYDKAINTIQNIRKNIKIVYD